MAYTEDEIVNACAVFYGYQITTKELSSIMKAYAELSKSNRGWAGRSVTTCGLAVWLKSRLAELTSMCDGGAMSSEIRLECEMHIGFIHIEETREHIARLRRRDPDKKRDTTARSRFAKHTATKAASPVNRTALLVAPTEGDTRNTLTAEG